MEERGKNSKRNGTAWWHSIQPLLNMLSEANVQINYTAKMVENMNKRIKRPWAGCHRRTKGNERKVKINNLSFG